MCVCTLICVLPYKTNRKFNHICGEWKVETHGAESSVATSLAKFSLLITIWPETRDVLDRRRRRRKWQNALGLLVVNRDFKNNHHKWKHVPHSTGWPLRGISVRGVCGGTQLESWWNMVRDLFWTFFSLLFLASRLRRIFLQVSVVVSYVTIEARGKHLTVLCTLKKYLNLIHLDFLLVSKEISMPENVCCFDLSTSFYENLRDENIWHFNKILKLMCGFFKWN